MTKPPHDEDPQNRIVAVTLDEESIGRSGPDIEHERAIAIYDLVTGQFKGLLQDANGNTIAINGLWDISPANNSAPGSYDPADFALRLLHKDVSLAC